MPSVHMHVEIPHCAEFRQMRALEAEYVVDRVPDMFDGFLFGVVGIIASLAAPLVFTSFLRAKRNS